MHTYYGAIKTRNKVKDQRPISIECYSWSINHRTEMEVNERGQ